MSNNAAEYLAMYPELEKQVIYTGSYPGEYTGNGVAIALKPNGIDPSQIEKVGCRFGRNRQMYLTFDQFIEHFGAIRVTNGLLDDNQILSLHLKTIHLKDGKIYSFAHGDGEYTTNRYVLAFNPNNFESYDNELIKREIERGILQVAEYDIDEE